jgi:hypothetical protein
MWPLGFLFDRFALSERTSRRARLTIARPVVLLAAAEHLLMASATLDSLPLQLGMLIYPGMTLLDLAGPQATHGMHGQTHLLWKTLQDAETEAPER